MMERGGPWLEIRAVESLGSVTEIPFAGKFNPQVKRVYFRSLLGLLLGKQSWAMDSTY